MAAARSLALGGVTLAAVLHFAVLAPPAAAAEEVPASLSDVRVSDSTVTATLLLRGSEALTPDPASLQATLGGESARVVARPAAQQTRSTILVIDTSGSMGASGMATVRSAVNGFLDEVPSGVKVGVVSFANTSGVDVAPTTDRGQVRREVAALRSGGETALYAGVQDAVAALGSQGERSIVLLSDGGDTVAEIEGGASRTASERQAALSALSKSKVRAEVIAFKSPEANDKVLRQFANAGGGSVANAGDRAAVAKAFTAAARALGSQTVLEVARPTGVSGRQDLAVEGTADGRPFKALASVDLGDTAPVAAPSPSVSPISAGGPGPTAAISASSPTFLIPAVATLALGVFLLVSAATGGAVKSRKRVRLEQVELYGMGRVVSEQHSRQPSALGERVLAMGDRVMEGRESTTRTLALLDRADLPWRAGEWLAIRLISILVGGTVGYLLLASRAGIVGLTAGIVLGFMLPALALRFVAKRRSRAFEAALPDVLMLVATSLSSGFSLLQALDAVAKDAAEPCAKEFSRALAETRIGADVSDALQHMADRMDSENMRWATMAIRIQRDVGGNLAETLRTTAATLREREMLRRQVRALSAEGRLSAYILIGLPIALFFYMLVVNLEYIQLLWTTLYGVIMLVFAGISLVVGIFWMRRVVEIEV